MASIYIGPRDFYWRFMSGLTVTEQNFREDGSLWDVIVTQRGQLERMGSVVSGCTQPPQEKKA